MLVQPRVVRLELATLVVLALFHTGQPVENLIQLPIDAVELRAAIWRNFSHTQVALLGRSPVGPAWWMVIAGLSRQLIKSHLTEEHQPFQRAGPPVRVSTCTNVW